MPLPSFHEATSTRLDCCRRTGRISNNCLLAEPHGRRWKGFPGSSPNKIDMVHGQRILITLIRHGKPHGIDPGWRSSAGFASWLQVEGDRGIDLDDSSVGQALSSKWRVYCSDLRRAIDSASHLTDPEIVCADPMFREAGLGALTAPGFIRLPIGAWTVLVRLAWFLRIVDGPESLEQARRRALIAAARLDADARKYRQVVVVGHGLFNGMVAAELRRLGWTGPRRPGHRYWESTTYAYEVPILD